MAPSTTAMTNAPILPRRFSAASSASGIADGSVSISTNSTSRGNELRSRRLIDSSMLTLCSSRERFPKTKTPPRTKLGSATRSPSGITA